jgi:ribose 5-phosphate isomerase B
VNISELVGNMLYIASDHGGFHLKDEIKKHFVKTGVEYVDLGPELVDPSDDYPDYAMKVASQVSKNPKKDIGIVFCRSGQGVNIVANKFKSVRSALAWNVKEAEASRHDDFSNVLAIPSDYVKVSLARKIVDAWLKTPYGSEERHKRRVNKITNLEKKLFK